MTRPIASLRGELPLLYSARLLGQLGQVVFMAGLVLAVSSDGASAFKLSGIVVAMSLGAILFGLPGGSLADRLGPGRALASGAAARLAVILGTVLLAGRPEAAPILAFLYSAVSQVYSPSELALVGELAPERPAQSHSFLVALQYAGQGAGLLIAGPAAFFIGGAPAMLLMSAGAYALVTVLALLLARSPACQRRRTPPLTNCGPSEAARYFIRNRHAFRGGVVLAFAELSAKVTFVALPIYLASHGLSQAESAVLVVPGAIGALAGLAWAMVAFPVHLAPRVIRTGQLTVVAAMLLLAGFSWFVDLVPASTDMGRALNLPGSDGFDLAVAVPAALMLGACFTVAPVAGRTILTSTAPVGAHSRVFAMQATFTDLLLVAPLLLAGALADVAGAQLTFLLIAAAGFGVLLLLPHPAHEEPGLAAHPALAWEPAPATSSG